MKNHNVPTLKEKNRKVSFDITDFLFYVSNEKKSTSTMRS